LARRGSRSGQRSTESNIEDQSRAWAESTCSVSKAFREAAGIVAGDNIVVTIEHDLEERTVEVPSDFATAISDAGLEREWERMSFTHRKQHVRAIEEAKQAATRIRRIVRAIEMIAARKK